VDINPNSITHSGSSPTYFAFVVLVVGWALGILSSPITDLIRHADDPARTDYYCSLRSDGDHHLIQHLRAAE